jgi:hypothetical protein
MEPIMTETWKCPKCRLPAYREGDVEVCYTCSYAKFTGSSGYYPDTQRGITLPCDPEATSETTNNIAQRTFLSAAQHCLAAANTRETLGETAAVEVARSLAVLFRDLAAVGKRTGRVPQREQLLLPFPNYANDPEDSHE